MITLLSERIHHKNFGNGLTIYFEDNQLGTRFDSGYKIFPLSILSEQGLMKFENPKINQDPLLFLQQQKAQFKKIYDKAAIINTPTEKHAWLKEEDFICCLEFIKRYIVGLSTTIQSCVDKLSKELPNLKSNSILYKLANIKQICFDLKIENSCPIVAKEHYSQQNMAAMKAAILNKVFDFLNY